MAEGQLIFAVDDEAGIRELYQCALDAAGFRVRCFEGAESLFAALREEMPDLLLLDVMLEGEDGYEILTRLRADSRTASLPVIMVSAKGEEVSKVKGLNLGADDYLAKPFGVMELVSCVKAVLRRCQPQAPSHLLQDGGISLDLDAHTVTANGQRVELTYKEFELLRLFLQHPGMAFTRDQLMEKVWGTDYYGETRTIDMHIRTLRQKLGICGEHIATVRGVGYRWEGSK